MSQTYRIIIEPDTKGFHGYVPALRGCHTWGKTIEATKKHLNEAILIYLESLVAHGDPIPSDTSFESFATVDTHFEKINRRRVHEQREVSGVYA